MEKLVLQLELLVKFISDSISSRTFVGDVLAAFFLGVLGGVVSSISIPSSLMPVLWDSLCLSSLAAAQEKCQIVAMPVLCQTRIDMIRQQALCPISWSFGCVSKRLEILLGFRPVFGDLQEVGLGRSGGDAVAGLPDELYCLLLTTSWPWWIALIALLTVKPNNFLSSHLHCITYVCATIFVVDGTLSGLIY